MPSPLLFQKLLKALRQLRQTPSSIYQVEYTESFSCTNVDCVGSRVSYLVYVSLYVHCTEKAPSCVCSIMQALIVCRQLTFLQVKDISINTVALIGRTGLAEDVRNMLQQFSNQLIPRPLILGKSSLINAQVIVIPFRTINLALNIMCGITRR